MSRFAIVPTAWLRDPSLSSHDKLVLTILASYADQQGYCWPSVATLAADASVSERQVQYCLKALRDVGALEVIPRTKPDGSDASNGYWLLGYDKQGGVQVVHRGGAQRAPGGVQEVHPNNTSTNRTSEHTTATTTSAFAFERPEHQQVYDQLRRSARLPQAFDAALRTCLEPMTGGPAYTLEQVGAALLELAGNGEPFNVSRLRGYLRRADSPAIPAFTPGVRRSQSTLYAEAARLLGITPTETAL